MNSTFDAEMRRVYAPLNRDHDRLRAELMVSLPEGVPSGRNERPHPGRPHWTGRTIVTRRVLPAGVGIAAAVALIVAFWPAGNQAKLAWADVARQLRSARTAHLHIVMKDPQIAGGREFVQDMYIKTPRRIRAEGLDPQTGKRKVIIVNGDRAAILLPEEKRYDAAPGSVLPASSAEDVLMMLCAPAQAAASQAQSRPADEHLPWQLNAQGTQERGGRTLHKYGIDLNSDRASGTPATGATSTFCWADPATGEVVLITQERTIDGKPIETMKTDVRLNIEIPEDVFSTEIPDGYGDAASVPKNVAEVLRKYYAARDGIRRYRLIVGEDQPFMYAARDGRNLYAANVNSQRVNSQLPFDELWKRMEPSPGGVSIHCREGRIARVLRRDGKVRDVRPHGDSNLQQYMLADLGWPELPTRPAYIPFFKGTSCRILPARPDRPGLIGIQYMHGGEPGKVGRMQILWLDPSKDYLCVYHENHQRKGSPWLDNSDWQPEEPVTTSNPEGSYSEHDSVREIVEFGRTPAGGWYPQAVRRSGAAVVDGKRKLQEPGITRVRVDFGPVADSLFDYPADVPTTAGGYDED